MDNVNSTRLGDIYIRRETDIVKVRDRVRRLAREVGFDSTTQIKVTTAVSEITRNIYEYAKSGAISLALAERDEDAGLMITARDEGPGMDETKLRAILRGSYQSDSGMGVGPVGNAQADGRIRYSDRARRRHTRDDHQVAAAPLRRQS
ncbi:MAG: ATP-binding protein [Pyrinomonadaceae bacterium]